jgi:xylulokinase
VGIFIGFDAGTQSLTTVAIDAGARTIVDERSLVFDEALPEYGTEHGVLPGVDRGVVEAPPGMWADALDRAVAVVAPHVDVLGIRAISGSAQQHGSVYLGRGAAAVLASLDPARPPAPQLAPIFSRAGAPVWLDCSTTQACAAITAAAGGAEMLARCTGSRAFERFTGPQIRKFAIEDPDGYARTERIHLVSSFMASLLSGAHAPVDRGDASGMNLMDIEASRWDPELVRATAPDLAGKLPPIVESWSIVGTLGHYWCERHCLPPARVVAWSGDNPCSLVGLGLVREGRLGISLGTSDTVFGYMAAPRIDTTGTGHVFGAPIGGYMGLTCFANGSLARERVRDAFGLDWTGFSDALRGTPPGNGGGVMLPWFVPEITPAVANAGVRRIDLDANDAAANVRAVVEGQMIALARHSRWIVAAADVIHVTGGASANRDVLQVMADVFGATVVPLETTNAAALGAALRAWHADELACGRALPWEEIVAPFVRPASGGPVRPRHEHRTTYDALIEKHAAAERAALR